MNPKLKYINRKDFFTARDIHIRSLKPEYVRVLLEAPNLMSKTGMRNRCHERKIGRRAGDHRTRFDPARCEFCGKAPT